MEASLIASPDHQSHSILLDASGTNDSSAEISQVLATTRQPIDLANVSSNLYTFSQPDVVTHYLQVLNNEAVDEQIKVALKEVGELLYQSFMERLARGDAPSKEAVVEIICIKNEGSTSDVQEEVRHIFLLQMRSEDEFQPAGITYATRVEDGGASTSFQRSNINSSQTGNKVACQSTEGQFGQKSKLSYTDMITMALSSSSAGRMSVHEIYQWISENFPHIRAKANKRWQGVVRTTLCQTNKFSRVGMVKSGHGGYVWSLARDTKPAAGSRVDGDDIDTDDEHASERIDQQPIEQDDNIELTYDNTNLTTVTKQQEVDGDGSEVDSSGQFERVSVDGVVALFLCDVCGKPCSDGSSLKAHQRKHAMPASHSCRYCVEVCVDNRSLREHISDAHADILQHACVTCEKSFVRYADLMRHQMTHSGERPFVCSTCGKTFTQSGGLKRHMDTHAKDSQQTTCSVCGRRLASAYCLQRHMRNHGDDSTKVACNVCGRRFAFVSVMERHRRCHTGERPYICHLCGKNFRDSGTLVIHMRTHSGERPYVCPYCDKRFRHKTNLNDHIKIHAGQDSHKCDDCGIRFTRHVTLLRHKRSCHAQDGDVDVKVKRQSSQTVVNDESST